MFEIAVYLFGAVPVYALLALMALHLVWQAYRMFSARSILVGTVAIGLIGATLIALWPPFDYPSLDRRMVAALIMLPLAGIAVFTEHRWAKLLPVGHIIFACAYFYVLIQAAR